jgi:sialate O-acetylesterase
MKRFILIVCISVYTLLSKAEVKLAHIFQDNMVIQRNEKILVYGLASPNEKVNVSIGKNQGQSLTGKDGVWEVELERMKAGGPFILKVKGENEITLRNILIGDVWICGGQSNMEWNVGKFKWKDDEIKEANFRNIRLFNVPNDLSFEPKTEITGGHWKEAVGKNIEDFSAVGYFFGKHICNAENVPIGLISSNWGGTNVEAWSSVDAVKKNKNVYEAYKQKTNSLKDITQEDLIDTIIYLSEDDIGISEKWFSENTNIENWDVSIIPSQWKEVDIGDFIGSVWFARDFDIPYLFKDKTIKFSFNNLNDYNQIWINGNLVYESYSRKSWASFIVTPEHLRLQGNRIVLRTVNFQKGKGAISQNPLWYNFHPIGESDGYQLLSGIWKIKKGLEYEYEIVLPERTDGMFIANENPASLYNAMINPLVKLKIKGVIWYQGESNAKRAYEYRTLFPNMIQDWREKFEQGDFPFLFVQLANFRQPQDYCAESDWAELREAQNLALSLPNVGMACAIDIGEAGNIHPSNKQEVGRRLSLVAQKIAYNKDLVHSGPMFESVKFVDQKAFLKFTEIGSGLMVKDRYGYLKGFCIAGDDRVFYSAKAEIKGNEVIVWNDSIKRPLAVRYGWADNPFDANLYNLEGLPTSPFRTDNWPGITVNNVYGKR